MTREEIELALVRGEIVQVGSDGADTITLATPRARRLSSTLFTYLRSNSVELLREDHSFFEVLEATDTATDDPAVKVAAKARDEGDAAARCWRLQQVSAYSDSRMSLGAMSWSLHEGDGDAMALRGLAAYRLEADALAPTARPGDTLLIRLSGSYRPPNLVIEDRGSSLAARRLIQDPDVPNLMVLSASSSNPRHTPRAIITREFGAKRWKIVGTLFTSMDMKTGDRFATDTEAAPCAPDDRRITALLADTLLVEVDGESAEPIALDEQYLLVKPERTDLVEACRDLDGRPVVALDHADQAFFKRLRNIGAGEVALESLDAAGVGELIMMSLSDGTKGREVLRSIRPVVGVIFEWLDGSH